MMKKRLFTFIKNFSKNKLALLGFFILLVIFFMAIFAPYLTPYNYADQNLQETFLSPSARHIMGTDKFGRDIFTRILFGARISLKIGFISMALAAVSGILIGLISGFYGGFLDNALMRLMDIMLSIPGLVMAIAISASLGGGMKNLIIAVAVAAIPGYAKIVRGQALVFKEKEFVEAARILGASDFNIMFKQILPNCLAPVIVQMTIGVGYAVLSAASLSFIGMGIEPPMPEWGQMLSEGRDFIRDYPYITMFPGISIAITILALNILGDGLRDALDPKLGR
ncbi:putative dipeptide ABC transporter, permease protein DppC [Clostridiales bacterium KA00134]|nr:putative dipeptide ABC transporter, permease protein DppC [Clostridiales bacterium KA00134]